VAVAGRPYDPRADTGDLQTPGRPQRLGTDGTTYLAWHPLSTDAVAQSAYRSHAYVAAFSLVTRYFTQRTPATTPPPAPPPGNAVPPCYSGSHCG
jgi:hypothetical protein